MASVIAAEVSMIQEGNEVTDEARITVNGKNDDKRDHSMEEIDESNHVNATKRGRKRKIKNSEAESEDLGQVTPASDRPSREKKAVDRYLNTDALKNSAAKQVSIEKGKGIPLKDIPNVAFRLDKAKADEELSRFHSVLFGTKGKLRMLKRNIGQFSGFVWGTEEDEEKQKKKVREKLDRCTRERLGNFCELLNIAKSSPRKDEVIDRIMEFLESPHSTTETLLSDKKKKSKKKKPTTTKKRTAGDALTASAKKRRKTAKKEEKQNSKANDLYSDVSGGENKSDDKENNTSQSENTENTDEAPSDSEKMKTKLKRLATKQRTAGDISTGSAKEANKNGKRQTSKSSNSDVSDGENSSDENSESTKETSSDYDETEKKSQKRKRAMTKQRKAVDISSNSTKKRKKPVEKEEKQNSKGKSSESDVSDGENSYKVEKENHSDEPKTPSSTNSQQNRKAPKKATVKSNKKSTKVVTSIEPTKEEIASAEMDIEKEAHLESKPNENNEKQDLKSRTSDSDVSDGETKNSAPQSENTTNTKEISSDSDQVKKADPQEISETKNQVTSEVFVKSEPTKEEITSGVAEIVKEVDIESTSFSQFYKLINARFGVDLIHRKKELKAIIGEVLDSLPHVDEGNKDSV